MTNTVIRVENLSKRYRIGGSKASYGTLRDALVKAAHAPFRMLRNRRHDSTEEFWALRDVSFEVKQGEILGIIGRNGAGKSTLLKILSRITEPTVGLVRTRGRVGSLLEVGTGFHPELTGRENIYLNGAILGMKRTEIAGKFDEIVEFAEIERFLDTPVKHYSSGMYTRLAFSVAAHLEPEILIVDEVLAVGDAAFQKKCLGRMGDVAKQGRTVLFVSHNMTAMQSLCDRIIWLHDGQLRQEGIAGQVISTYLQTSFSSLTEHVWATPAVAPGNSKVRLHRVCVRPVDGHPIDRITVRMPFVFEFEYWNLNPGAHLNLSLHIYNEQGIMVFNAVPLDEPNWQGRPFPGGLFRDTCFVPGDLLNDGMHRVELLVVKDDTVIVYQHDDILVFAVDDDVELRGAWYGKWQGAVRPVLQWRTELIEADIAPLLSSVEHDSKL